MAAAVGADDERQGDAPAGVPGFGRTFQFMGSPWE